MSENLPKLAVETFSTVLQLKLQQKTSKLRGRVMEGQHVGKQASPVDYIGAMQMKAPAGRFAPNQPQNVDFTRRWVLPVDKEGYQLIDSFDKLRLLMDPTSQYSSVASAAVAREWDDRIIAAAFATATIGDTTGVGTTTEAFSTTNWQIASTFGSAAASGLTVAKMIEAKRVMRKAQVEVDEEQLTWITNSQGESDLLNQVQVVSTEFSDKPVLQEGKVTRFMGWDIVYSERLTSSSNLRQNIAMVKSGAYLGVWKDQENYLDPRYDLSGRPWQLSTLMTSGATRLEPGRLLQVLCSDTSAAADVTP
ncbi:phage capsid protein [Bradyrhizobium sp. SZCCHNRI1073]|uniref:phage capsid protein n=1 Tax=Bradyrhizobium sp. SZCCHNRI1073 TaxID=3057280 RepID=UPI00291711DE|nr:phage capsid protein [Bradyrhizobium sp. SZCCHNRI1073]